MKVRRFGRIVSVTVIAIQVIEWPRCAFDVQDHCGDLRDQDRRNVRFRPHAWLDLTSVTKALSCRVANLLLVAARLAEHCSSED